MATEIERKFLVKGEFKHLAIKHIDIIQAYLTIEKDKTIRLRVTDDNAYLTVKGKPPTGRIGRKEWEVSIPVEDAREMMSICVPGKIVKTRYIIPYSHHTWEVDVFHEGNAGLVIAEIELNEEDEKFDLPEWVGEEVTGLPQYYNANILK
jgi:adenylate cyclase